jgi:LysM repeat protein
VIYVHLPVSPGAGSGQAVASRSKSKQKKAVTATKGSTDPVLHHKVREGETLFSIASIYKTTVDALKRDNRNVAVLRPGMVLVIRP